MPAAEGIRHLVLILTSRCNLHCTYCYQTARKALSMDWETARASIDLARSLSGRGFSLLFTGGEPLLEWPLLLRAAEYAAPDCETLEVCTNGLLLSDAVIADLDRLRFQVHLSFDGVAEAQETRSEGSFAALDRILDRLRRQAPELFETRLRISAIQTPATVPFLAASVRYFIGRRVRDIVLAPPLSPSEACGPELLRALDAQFGEVFDCCFRHLARTGEVPVSLFRKSSLPTGAASDSCNAAGGRVLAVDVDGKAYGCPVFAESYQDLSRTKLAQALAPLRMGDVRHAGFRGRHAAYVEAADRSPLFRDRAERYSAAGRCSECPCRDACRICPASAGRNKGDLRRVPEFVCGYYRTAFRYRERFPAPPDSRFVLSDSRFAVRCLGGTGVRPWPH